MKGAPPSRASRLAVPHIKIRRVPKLFMQESPVLAETFRVNSSAGPSGPRGRRDCNTGKQLPLCMNQHNQSMRARPREYDQRCKRGNMFHIASPCGPAVRTFKCMQVIVADSIAHSTPGLAASALPCCHHHEARDSTIGGTKDGDRSSALATLIPATIWK